MRRSFLLIGLLLVVITPESLFGQLGGLRRRAQEMVTPKPQQREAVQPVPVNLNDDVLTRYLKGLAARNEAMRRLARENTPIGQYFAAVVKRDSLQRRQNDYRAETGPDWARSQQLQAAMMQGNTDAARQHQQLQAEMDPNKVELPQADWNAQKEGNYQLDSIAMVGGGFSAGEWAYIIDQVPPLLGLMTFDGAETDSLINAIVLAKRNISADQVKAVRARRLELARALVMSYRTDAMIAREGDERRRAGRSNEPDPKTYNGCLTIEMKPVSDSMAKRQPEIDEAAKRNDVAKLSEIAGQLAVLQSAAAQKCAPLLNQ